MPLSFRFAIVSDPHIALPKTIWDNPSRFHLVEVSIPALEYVLAELAELNLDFLLVPGDLTQHGEPENHEWFATRLAQLPYPVYVVPGNHDIVQRDRTEQAIGLHEFAGFYQKFGYCDGAQPYYVREVVPGVALVGLNSIAFDEIGTQLNTGLVDEAQLHWLRTTLAELNASLVMVMIHHNVLEHMPGQSRHSMGQRYMLHNAPELLALLRSHQVPLVFTGHLHVQDIAQEQGITEITTGSLVSYPHPYRVLHYTEDDQGDRHLRVETYHVPSVPGWEDLAAQSREWMGDRSNHFMYRFLTQPPISMSPQEAQELVPDLRYFWADIARGDAQIDYPHFPKRVRRYLQAFSAVDPQGNLQLTDNNTILKL
ncbi:metallophosphoesterase family protein [Leptolyngbya sp. AN02str]|uniref:metallophosphoesterase family protein n=1 Tax=Leptolyngbya sp. AN02str TaxID=3423363 RepID=UPI003D32239E